MVKELQVTDIYRCLFTCKSLTYDKGNGAVRFSHVVADIQEVLLQGYTNAVFCVIS